MVKISQSLVVKLIPNSRPVSDRRFPRRIIGRLSSVTDFLQNPNRNPSEDGLRELLDKYLILGERLRRLHPTTLRRLSQVVTEPRSAALLARCCRSAPGHTRRGSS